MGTPHSSKPRHEIDQAGGAYVRRRFTFGTRELQTGDTLTAAELAGVPRANLNALINTGKLELWPSAPGTFIAERFAVHLGFGKWIVVEGRQVTPEPVTKEEAERLVGQAL